MEEEPLGTAGAAAGARPGEKIPFTIDTGQRAIVSISPATD